jgi:hypothetical protein
MASQALAHPRSALCPDKVALGNTHLEVVHEFTQLQESQAWALIHGGAEFEYYDLGLKIAHERHDMAKFAYVIHLRKHGC